MGTRHILAALVFLAAVAAWLPASAAAAPTCSNSNHLLSIDMTGAEGVAFSVSGSSILVTEYPSETVVACSPTPLLNNIDTVDVDVTDGANVGNTVRIVNPAAFAPGFALEQGKSEIEFSVGLGGSFFIDDTIELVGTAGPDSYRIGADGINVNGNEPNTIGGDVDIAPLPYIVDAEGNDGDDAFRGNGGLGTGSEPLATYMAFTGGPGDDTLVGAVNADNFVAGPGNDRVDGRDGDDYLKYTDAAGGVAVDLRNTGPQDTGGAGVDTITSVTNVDGSPFADRLIGEDSVFASLNGGAGDDVLEGAGGADALHGGPGFDLASYEHAPEGITANLAISGSQGQDTSGAGSDSIGDEVEGLRGSAFRDVLLGDEKGNVLEGLGELDTLDAAAGSDTLLARDGGPDAVTCGADVDSVTADPPGVDNLASDCETVAFGAFVPPASGPGGSGGTDVTAAVARGLRVVPATLRAAPEGASVAGAPVGARVGYRLSEAATMRFTVQRRARGRRVGRRCVKPTARNRKRRRCVRFVGVRGSFSDVGAAGANDFRFTGRLRGRKLRPGRYRLVGVPTDLAGNRGKPVRAPFRIVRR
jgi:Ca2+-binding RTX toxin-like protein